MEKASQIMGKVVDSLKQESQEKQTGSGIMAKCEKHKTEMVKDGFRTVCRECEEDESRAKAIESAHKSLDLPPRLKKCTFDSYKPTCQKAVTAKKICGEYVKEESEVNSLIMIGGVGTGKTHLAVAMCQAVCDQGKTVKVTTVSRIIRDIRSTWAKNSSLTEEDVIGRYSVWCPFLVIDEIGSQYGSESEKVILSEIINDRYNHNLKTVIVGNVTIDDAISHLGARVIDRLKDNGKIIIFDWESNRKLNV